MTAAALILAAGEGTRMKSDLPKVAHTILGVPMLSYVIQSVEAAGVERTVLVTGHGAELVEEIAGGRTCVRQDEQRGTGHAVMCAREAFGDFEGSLVVLSGDTPLLRSDTISRLVEAREKGGAAVALLTARVPDPHGYGRIVRDEEGGVSGIVEHADLETGQEALSEVNTGTYCFDAAKLFGDLDILSDDNSQGELYLTDMIGHFHTEGLGVVALESDLPEETMGINTRAHLADATAIMQVWVNESLMLSGVTMSDPSLVWVAPTVRLGRDVTLEPMTFLLGETQVADGAHLGPNTRVVDTYVGENARVDSSVALGARIGPGVSVGPMAYLRPGTELAKGSKAGTFVEIKNSIVGQGSKVPHLSYIGDARIGDAVNVGAGSITCNYDGRAKHVTEIGDGAFVGSDTMFVAPVSIGKGAITGAGSVITEDVPDDALGVARERQRNLAGWAARWRTARRDQDE